MGTPSFVRLARKLGKRLAKVQARLDKPGRVRHFCEDFTNEFSQSQHRLVLLESLSPKKVLYGDLCKQFSGKSATLLSFTSSDS